MKGKRKLAVFIICLLAGLGACLYMDIDHYKVFLNNLVWLAIGFFASNAVTNIGGYFGKGGGNGQIQGGG